MNRAQKRCVLASTALHLGLLSAVVLLSAFQPPSPPPVSLEPISFNAYVTTDEMISGGGDRTAQPLPPTVRPLLAPQAQPQPPPPPPPPVHVEKAREPEPLPSQANKEPRTKPDTDSLTPAPTKAKKPQIDFNAIVSRSRDQKNQEKERAEQRDREQARAEAEAHKKLLGRFGQIESELRENHAGSGIAIKMFGPGGGGVPYANFLQAVQHAYEQDWRPRIPKGVSDEVTATASVTIARDGTVTATSLIRSSGNRQVDDSVRASLDNVRYAAPLPPNAEENERTISIEFDVKIKPGTG